MDAGYEAQIKFWWFPFCWFQCHSSGNSINTWGTIDNAESFIKKHSQAKKVVKYIKKQNNET